MDMNTINGELITGQILMELCRPYSKVRTGYTAQYSKEVKEIYEDINTCPEELLLFFHHVPYSHKLKSESP